MSEQQFKRCPRCGKLLPADYEHYGRNASMHDGLSVYCSKCKREYGRERRALSPDKIERMRLADKRAKHEAWLAEFGDKAKGESKTCSICKLELPATDEFFPYLRAGKFGLCCRCKECDRQYYNRRAYLRRMEAQRAVQ